MSLSVEACLALRDMEFRQKTGCGWALRFGKWVRESDRDRIDLERPEPITALDWIQGKHGYKWHSVMRLTEDWLGEYRAWKAIQPDGWWLGDVDYGKGYQTPSDLILAIATHWKAHSNAGQS